MTSPLSIINNSYADLDEKILTAKVYYSLMNHLILVPTVCKDAVYFKACVVDEINRSL